MQKKTDGLTRRWFVARHSGHSEKPLPLLEHQFQFTLPSVATIVSKNQVTRKIFLLLLVGILLAFLANRVSAHAILVRSTPKAHEVVPSGDLKMELEFNSRIDAARSILELVLPGGEIQKLQLSPQPSAAALAATAAHLGPGNYTIRWQVLSNDGHITRGEIPFEVK